MKKNKGLKHTGQPKLSDIEYELKRKDEEIEALKELNGQYWERIQAMRLSNRLKKWLGIFEWRRIKNQWRANSPFERKQKNKPRIAIKMPAPDWLVADSWGDYYFSISLKKALVKLGYNVTIQVVSEWYNDQGKFDVILVLRGPVEYEPNPSHFNLMWNISHPNEVSVEEYEKYNHIFVASNIHAETLKNTLTTKVSTLLQCTDPDRFYPVKRKKNNRILFVGNSHGQLRPAVGHALETGHDVDIYGNDWEGVVDDKCIKGSFIPNHKLRFYYSGYGIVLNDHWEDMKNLGFVSNRVFDVLACNGTVLSDCIRGIPESIKNYIYTYNTNEEFKNLTDLLLTTPNQSVKHYSIEHEHSFDARVQKIISIIKDKKCK